MDANKHIKQAEEFLTKTETNLTVEFVKHNKYWDDDKETRDIYKFALTRGNRSYSANFGQSCANSLYHCADTYSWSFGLCKTTTGPIPQGTLNSKMKEEQLRKQHANKLIPNAYDILSCFTKSDPGTFENFCGDFGYETDSIKATKNYEAVRAEYLGLCALFTDKEMEELQEIN